MHRRQLLQSALLGSAVAALPRLSLAMASADKAAAGAYDYVLTAEAGNKTIVAGHSSDILGFNGQFPAPVIRARQGEPLRVKFVNKLDMASTIHWHGIRLPNAMDGVPWLTQPPVQAGESFIYEFTPPDAGTFWYHPHIHSIEQLGKGLVGALIVEEREPQHYHEVIVGLKDWRLDKDGSYLPLSLPREAARTGTLGTVSTINGEQRPTISVPADQLLRLRFLNMDNTRVVNLALGKHPAKIIAMDGSPLAAPRNMTTTAVGAGMRLDVALRSPAAPGEEIAVFDMKGRFGVELCRLRSSDTKASAGRRNRITALPANPIPRPQLSKAEPLSFVFEWQGALSPSDDKGELDHSFWLINRRAWTDHSHQHLPAPLASLQCNKSYVVSLHNATPHHHPIHLHGLIFTVLKSDKREIEPYETDTILLEKNERASIAFVADNPGKWMFHCHVIEHMKTGLMGYIEIS